MIEKIFTWFVTLLHNETFLNIALVVVGTSAIFVYGIQERRKRSEAAALITMQVEDLQKRIREIRSYIVEGHLKEANFYESQILFQTDYWNKYKHYFIKKMDAYSFNTFDEFYSCVATVLEQQELMKNIQKNFFFLTQQIFVQIQEQYIINVLNQCNVSSADERKTLEEFRKILTPDMAVEQKKIIENILKKYNDSLIGIDFDLFWNMYNQDKKNIDIIFKQSVLAQYTPGQIRISLENILNKLNTISIVGCQGYNKLKKLAKRRL